MQFIIKRLMVDIKSILVINQLITDILSLNMTDNKKF